MSNPISNNIFRRLFSLLLFVISIFFFSICKVHAVLEPTLVKDINSGSASSMVIGAPYYDTIYMKIGNLVLFPANDGVNGTELWKSDGTSIGTKMVKDINVGAGSSLSGYEFSFYSVSGLAFFRANDGVHGYELWVSDGTETGTHLVKDIDPGSTSSDPWNFAAIGNILYFSASDDIHGNDELWKSDGTEEGTVFVKDIVPGTGSGLIYGNISVGNQIFFTACTDLGCELWKSDGTEEGTTLVKDISIGAGHGWPDYKYTADGILYFRADDDINGIELWQSDGTSEGTFMIKDVYEGSSGSNVQFIHKLGNNIYFDGNDGVHGFELWESDGTEAGTFMVKDFYPGNLSGGTDSITSVGQTLFFKCSDELHSDVLCKSDGTEIGTEIVSSKITAVTNEFRSVGIGGNLYFIATDGINGYQLWKSDGSDEGTIMLTNTPSAWNRFPEFTVLGDTVFFTFDDATHGDELWKLDVDIRPPLGSVSINSGSQSTTTPTVTLTFDATDVLSTVTSMIVCDDASFTGCEWEIYQTSKTWIFNETEGTKTIYVKYKDSEGNESGIYSDSILLQYPLIPTPEVKVVKSPIKYINPVVAEVPKEEQPEVQEEEKVEEEKEEVKESGIQILQFVDEQGNPIVGAVVVMEGKEYVTDGRGEIGVKNFNKNKTYKVDIEYKGMKYTEEVLGSIYPNDKTIIRVAREEVESKGFDWRIPVYIFLGVILVLILFFLLSKDKKEEQQVPLD